MHLFCTAQKSVRGGGPLTVKILSFKKFKNSAGGGIEGEEYSEEDALKLDGYSIHIRAFGESFDTEKHPPGTEIKAITYSNLRVDRRLIQIFIALTISFR